MFYEHSLFELPGNLNVKIWRYMDFTKLISSLEKGTLYFARSDKLGDPFEGKISQMTVHAFKEDLKQSYVSDDDIAKMVSSMKAVHDDYRKIMFVNCWHLSNHESAAMWKTYLKSNEVIAIQSTCKRFAMAFDVYPDFVGHLGKVKYIDYDRQKINEKNMFSAFLHKRKSFEYEKEIRAIAYNAKILKADNIRKDKDGETIGYHLECNLETLIEKIYVSPPSNEWFLNIVKSVVKKFGINKQVSMSKISENPLY